MKILLTNDDGINAPGLCAAAQGLRHLGEVFVVAPEHEHSGVGASLTLRSPLTVRRVSQGPEMPPDAGGKSPHPTFPKGESGWICPPGVSTPSFHSDPAGTEPFREIVAYAVGGTPADSCVLALEQVVGPVDLVVSGINPGSNLGWDVMISGTVGAAIQGYVRGYPSIVISVAAVKNPRFEESAMLLGLIVERLAGRMVGFAPESPPRFLLNINVPSVPLSEIKSIRVTRMGDRSYAESVRVDGDGEEKRYWIDRNRPVAGEAAPNTDIWALRNGLISVTPLHLNLGNHGQIPEIEYFLKDILKQPVN